jgi:hypothetical protein
LKEDDKMLGNRPIGKKEMDYGWFKFNIVCGCGWFNIIFD